MLNPDPKWLEILKASGWQTTAIAIACGLFLIFAHVGLLPTLPHWGILLVSFAGLICGCLAVASWCSAIYKFFPLHKWFVHWSNIQRSKRGLRNYIPYMTPKEKEIIGYLLAKNLKTFTADSSGGYASTLLSRGIVIILTQPGQHLSIKHVPMTIPDPLWDVLIQHKSQFPYVLSGDGKETHPWRVHWMVE